MVLLVSSNIYAETDEPLKWNVSAGFGVPNLSRYSKLVGLPSDPKSFQRSGKGPFYLKAEYKPEWWFGIGLNINHMSYKVTYIDDNYTNSNGMKVPNKVTVNNVNTAFNMRANLHVFNPKHYGTKADVYWGIGIGYKVGKLKVSSEYSEATPTITLPNLLKIGFETTFGMKYYFTDHIGAFGEIGLAKSIFQFGVTGAF